VGWRVHHRISTGGHAEAGDLAVERHIAGEMSWRFLFTREWSDRTRCSRRSEYTA
jgi:hypothetical protein